MYADKISNNAKNPNLTNLAFDLAMMVSLEPVKQNVTRGRQKTQEQRRRKKSRKENTHEQCDQVEQTNKLTRETRKESCDSKFSLPTRCPNGSFYE